MKNNITRAIRSLIISLSALWSISAEAQTELNEESYSTIGHKRWEMQYQDEDGNNKFMEYEMENISDTLINGLRYVPVSFYEKALEVTYSCIELKMDYDHRDTIFCRQEGEKVYFVPKGETEDFLVLDYGLNIGDSYTNPAGDEFVVVERGTFPKYASQVYTYGKRAPMMLKLQSKDGTKEDVWIEGLGSTVWGIDPRLSAYNAHTCFARTGGRNDHELDAVYNVFLDKYKFASFMPQEPERHETDESWSVSFHADTLCVKGIAGVRDFNGPNYFEMIVTEDNVIAMTDFLSPHSHPYISNKYTDIDVRIPGFEAGTYMFGTESLVCEGAEDDYIPFVERDKQWHVLGFSVFPNLLEVDYYFDEDDEAVNIDGKTYLNLYSVYENNKFSLGLFREEDKRVYRHDGDKDILVYDFNLNVGDTFDNYIATAGEYIQCVVTKVGYIEVGGKKLRTITFSFAEPVGYEEYTWVEGIGNLTRPWDAEMYAIPTCIECWSYRLAYVRRNEQPYDGSYFPFSIFEEWGDGNFVYGQELVQGEEMMTWEEFLEKGAPLYQEIKDGKLHIWGYLWFQPCPNKYYLYCKLSPKEDHKTYTVSLDYGEVGLSTDCNSNPYTVDLYFDLPSPESEFKDYDYIFIDEEGEHPIVNHNKYHPFVEEGKVWKVVWTDGYNPAKMVKYFYFEGDTIMDGQSFKKMMYSEDTKEYRNTYFWGGVREDDKKVFFHPNRNNSNEELLYDFGASVGDELNVFPYPSLCKVTDKDTVTIEDRSFPRTKLQLQRNYFGEEVDTSAPESPIDDEWLEGIGYLSSPCEGINQGMPFGMYFNALTDCVTESGTLFHCSQYAEEVSQFWLDEVDAEGDVKRETLDFTHVIKTKPTNPAIMATPPLLRAEYNNIALFIYTERMSGQYQFSIRKDNGSQDIFTSSYNLGNLRSIDFNLAGYSKGEYTITVENDKELFTAHFLLPLDGTGINEIENEEMRNGENENAIYDLSGRKISSQFKVHSSQLQKGIYIQDGRKVVKK